MATTSTVTRTGKVLIIEDNIPNMMMAKELLELAGFQTLQAENADIGVRMAREQHPDLILMDMHLPILDGYEASRILKSDEQTRDIVIVAFTALAMEEEQEKALAHGCSGVISKPIDVDRFADRISEFLSQPCEPPAFVVTALESGRPLEGFQEAVRSMTGEEDASALRIQQLEEALVLSNARIEQFLLRASHDLQSPLRKISLFSEMLQKTAGHELSTDNQKFLAGVVRSTQHMQDILSDLLTLSRLHRNPKMIEPVALSKVITEIIDENREQLKSLGVRVELGSLITLNTDPAHLKQLLHELFGNALKFSPAETTPVIRITSGIEDNKYYAITVEDNGIGLELRHAERIFLPLERLHGVSQYSGRGMGLAIAKKIVECHAGLINVDSVPGQGATFTVLLPIPHG